MEFTDTLAKRRFIMGNNLKYAREFMIKPTTDQDTADAQAFALIAIAEQLAKNNNILTDVGVAKGWWELSDKEKADLHK